MLASPSSNERPPRWTSANARSGRSRCIVESARCINRRASVDVAAQLPRVRRPRQRRRVGREVDHPLNGGERFVVVAELQLGVAERAVQDGAVGVDRESPFGESPCRGEIVTGRRKRRRSGVRQEVVGVVDLQRSGQRAVGARVVGRIDRDLGLLDVGEPERGPRDVVVGNAS